jgi:segregation and condensation protein B
MGRRGKSSKDDGFADPELSDLPPELRWREWMGRVEAAIFASTDPVPREILAGLVGRSCNLELLIADIRAELKARPYDLVLVAGGYQHRTREKFAAAIRAILPAANSDLSKAESLVLAAIAYFQPVTRAKLSEILGREVSRDLVASLRGEDLIAAGPRSPEPGAPYTYVTTKGFLIRFGFTSLNDLPDIEALADAGLIGRADGVEKLDRLKPSAIGAGEGGALDSIEFQDAAETD